MFFRDRSDAGRRLASALAAFARQDLVVLALPRGGVPVAAEIAEALHAPLDLVLARKLGVPFEPELAMGAVAEGEPPIVVRNEQVIAAAGVDEAAFQSVLAKELAEMARRRRAYLSGAPGPEVAGRLAIVVDDGVATGATTRAALRSVRARGPAQVVLAVPVAEASVLHVLRREADEIVALEHHLVGGGIGLSYDDFHQIGDAEVIRTLARFRPGPDHEAGAAPAPASDAGSRPNPCTGRR
jgi:predicted phosphoribosyltransferase